MIRDRKYLTHLRGERCILTGLSPSPTHANDPAHIGTAGRGIKIGDDCALPIRHYLHVRMHNEGEMSVIRQCIPDHMLRLCLRAYARELYREWKDAQEES